MTSRIAPSLPNPGTQALAELTARTRFRDLPDEVVHAVKRVVLDTLGCVVAGAGSDPAEIIARVMRRQGGQGEAGLLGRAGRLPAARAAYVNCYAANALDACDDLHYKAHIASAVVPAALAVAERQAASGPDLIAAIAVGYEVAARVGMSLKGLTVIDGIAQFAPTTGYGWCALGAGAGAASLLGLDAERARHALAITAVTLPVPSSTQHSETSGRAMTKYTMYGTMAEAGITAALLAEEGFTGLPAILDGDKGLWRALGSTGYDPAALTDRLGERWFVRGTSFKLYPACRFTSAATDLFYDLMEQERLTPDEIDRVEVGLIDPAIAKHIDDPTVSTFVDGQFSMPYVLAVAAFGVPPGPQWHHAATRDRADVRVFMEKVSVAVEPTAAAKLAEDIIRFGHARRMPTTLSVTARGRVFASRSDWARGDLYNAATALTDAELEEKFRAFATGIRTPEQTDRAIEAIWQLDRLPDLDPLTAPLCDE